MIDETKLIDEVNDLMDANLLFYDDASKSRQETLEEVADLIYEQPKVGEWIPVEDRLPEIFENVLIYTKSGHYHIGAYFEERKRWWLGVYWEDLDFILAWMPLPKPYECHSNKTRKEKQND